MEFDMTMIEQLDIPFLNSPWFYLAVLIVAFLMKAVKDKDMKIHKRWYMPIAAVLSLGASVLVVLFVKDYGWSSLVIQTVSVYFGQHLFGDQIIKRFEKKVKGE